MGLAVGELIEMTMGWWPGSVPRFRACGCSDGWSGGSLWTKDISPDIGDEERLGREAKVAAGIGHGGGARGCRCQWHSMEFF